MKTTLQIIGLIFGIALCGSAAYFNPFESRGKTEQNAPDIPFEIRQEYFKLSQLKTQLNELETMRARAEHMERRLINLLNAAMIQHIDKPERIAVLSVILNDAKEREIRLASMISEVKEGGGHYDNIEK